MVGGRYYIGRVIKLGTLNQKRLMDAIGAAVTIAAGKSRWTITNVVDRRGGTLPFVFGRLTKFADEGHVTVVDTETKSEADAIAQNLVSASAPFVYLPAYSGIAYLHVWNGIENETFARRFKSVIEATYLNFFVECSIEPVSDYRQFAQKLRNLNEIKKMTATVYPPNPLFGRLWESLDTYIKRRNATEVSVMENQAEGGGLKTQLLELIESILKDSKYLPNKAPDITDAAMLMAADGYGSGRVVGEQDGAPIVIRTADTQKSFLFTKDPIPAELAEEANNRFQQISEERDMNH